MMSKIRIWKNMKWLSENKSPYDEYVMRSTLQEVESSYCLRFQGEYKAIDNYDYAEETGGLENIKCLLKNNFSCNKSLKNHWDNFHFIIKKKIKLNICL